MSQWPTQAEVLSNKSVYGNPRSPKDPTKASAAWEAANLVFVQPPFEMFYAGRRLTRGFRMHRHCAPAMARVLSNLWDQALGRQEVIDYWGVSIFAGAAYFKTMTGNSRLLSMHSYGAAIDLDPARNGWKDRSPRFGSIPEVLAAFRAEGARWGGDWNGNGSSEDERYADGMHWQFTA